MQLSVKDLTELSRLASSAARQAGQLIAGYAHRAVPVQHKEAGDQHASQVVTEVDRLSEALILDRLQPSCGRYGLALLTEEREDDRQRLEKDHFWCIDPLDGTLSFIDSAPGYAVSIALVARSGTPLVGVVYDPLTATLYSAVQGQGALRNDQPWDLPAPTPGEATALTLVCDRSLLQQSDYAQQVAAIETLARAHGLAQVQTLHNGGAVMNALWVLENPPACYFKRPKPQDGGGSLWDFAATACLFNELGAVVWDYFGQPLELNRADSTFMNHRGVIFATDQAMAKVVKAIPHRLDSHSS